MNFLHISFCFATIIGSIVASEVNLDDFDQVAKAYAEGKAKEYGRSLAWYDIYGKHHSLQRDPNYHQYKVEAWSDHVEYGKVDKTIEKPGHIYSQWYHNSQSVPITAEFSREVELKSSYSWSTSSNFRMNHQIDVSVGVPEIFLGINVKINTTVELQSSKSKTVEETEKYGVKNIITIPPKKSVKAEFIVTEKDMQIPWEADVHLTGYIAMWFEPKHDGHWLWFHPLMYLANQKYQLVGFDRLVYRTKGMFRGLKGIDSVLKTTEYEVTDFYPSNNAPRRYQNSTKVTYTKPILVKLD